MTAPTLPLSTGGLLGTSTDYGVSPDASAIRRQLLGILSGFYESFYFHDIHKRAHLSLQDAVQEASTDNWDGYGGKRVTQGTFRNAVSFLRSLPTAVPGPEVSVQPDGEIAFEWSGRPGRAFSVSIGEGDTG